jgi:hypothetical protein
VTHEGNKGVGSSPTTGSMPRCLPGKDGIRGQGKAVGTKTPPTALLFLVRLLSEAKMPARRFPPPWSVEELEACFVVRDHSGQKLAYVYYEDEPGPTLGDEAAYCRCGVDVRDDGTIGARDDGGGLRAGSAGGCGGGSGIFKSISATADSS